MPRTKKPRGEDIEITDVNFFVDQTQENNHTDEFESDNHLVVRRGEKIEFQVTFSRPLSGDHFELELHRGYRTSFRRGTRFVAEFGKKPQYPHQLEVKEVKSDGPKVKFSISIPATMPVGSYRVALEVSPEQSRAKNSFEYEREMVILFNPWCKDDGVFMGNEAHRQEYVLNENGHIWAGTHDDMFTWPWNFAQFETASLEAALCLLDLHSNLDSDARKDPILVTRAFTEMVNMNDSDGGILFGLWSPDDEDYKDGTDPTAWSGSSAILEEFLDTRKPVRYAQCWVFGGTLTTVLRTMGIPARPVTNFESAHDADANRAIDYFYDLEDEMVEEKSGDSIWNYHVWAEAWMARPDLGPSYGGWQAVDATPQELSTHSRSFVVGPASIAAIKDGEGGDMKYDNEFVISEVNADVKYFYEVKSGDFELAGSNTTKVGKNISTKAVGSNKRDDVTNKYKHPEGSVAERAALGATGEAKKTDVQFEVEFNKRASIGEDFNVVVKTRSSAKVKRTVRVRTIVHAMTYTGAARKLVKKYKETVELRSGGSGQCSFTVSARDYMDKLSDQALLNVTVLALVEDTNQSWVGKLPYRLRQPALAITVDGKKGSEDRAVDVAGGQSHTVKASFTNPLAKPLTNVVFYVEGARLVRPQKIEGKTTPAGKMVEVSLQITPKKPRKKPYERTLIITCQSKELKGTMGTALIRVK